MSCFAYFDSIFIYWNLLISVFIIYALFKKTQKVNFYAKLRNCNIDVHKNDVTGLR